MHATPFFSLMIRAAYKKLEVLKVWAPRKAYGPTHQLVLILYCLMTIEQLLGLVAVDGVTQFGIKHFRNAKLR